MKDKEKKRKKLNIARYKYQTCNHVRLIVGFAALAKPNSRKIINFFIFNYFLIFLIFFIFLFIKKNASDTNFLLF